MPAASTDYFTKVGSPGTATSLSAPGHTAGGASISVVSTTNWPTDTGVVFAMDTVTIVNGEEVRDPGSYTEWEGIVSGATTISSMVLRYGTDQNYPAGSTTRVYIPVASSFINRLIEGLLSSVFNQDGTLQAQTDLGLTTPKITTSINDSNGNEIIKTPATASAVNEVTVTNSATGNPVQIGATGGDTNIHVLLQGKGTGSALLGKSFYQQAAVSGNTTSASYATLTGSITMTLPTGTWWCRVTCFGAVYNNTAGQTTTLQIMKGGSQITDPYTVPEVPYRAATGGGDAPMPYAVTFLAKFVNGDIVRPYAKTTAGSIGGFAATGSLEVEVMGKD